MTSLEMNAMLKKQNRKNLPLRFFAWANILIAFFLGFYLLKVGISETAGALLEETLVLLVMPEPLNEMGEKEGTEAKEEKADENQDEENLAQNNPRQAEKQKQWASLFSAYAQKITVKQTSLIHEILFDIDPKTPLPMNQGDVDIAFEVYDKDKEYLFTFYGNYWHEDGYDEGEYWHQWAYNDSVFAQFPYAGEFYIVAGIPQGNNDMYQKIIEHSNGKVQVRFYSNSKPFPASSALGMFFFLVVGGILIGLRKRMSGEPPVYPYNFTYIKPDFKNYHYIVSLNGENYYVNGFIKKEKTYNSFELVLEKDRAVSFLEMEKETEDGETEYYAYHYNQFPEDDFSKLPKQETLSYQGMDFNRSSESGAPENISIFYANELTEDVVKTEIVFESTEKEPSYLCFEYGEDPEDFDVSYGHPVKGPKFRRIKK